MENNTPDPVAFENAVAKYPALMAYIAEGSKLETAAAWCRQMHADEAEARENGAFADVAMQMMQAKADFLAAEKAAGRRGDVAFNLDMGIFLGLPINPGNHEPPHGYYMAGCVENHYRLGVAMRKVQAAIDSGVDFQVVIARTARNIRTGERKPLRFARFRGPDQIKISPDFRSVICQDSKRKITLSGNWSIETVMERVAVCFETGQAYGGEVKRG